MPIRQPQGAYEEARENADRMAMYRPTKSHRAAFERLCRGLYQPNDRKFYLLSGSYGTGKSHLTLMLANALSRSSGDPGMKGFFGNYEKLDPDTAKMLRNVRRDGQYLVAICDYYSGKHFEEVVLKAIFDACRSAGLDVELQSEFDEAGRLLMNGKRKGRAGSGISMRISGKPCPGSHPAPRPSNSDRSSGISMRRP